MDAHGAPYLILVVEDDPDHAALIEAVFAHGDRDAQIHVARSAEEAIAYVAGPWPDTDWGRSELARVIVLDILMPGMGGLGFLKWYRLWPEIADIIPIVVFTSSDDPDLARQCIELGAREFKVKPTNFDELVDVVQRVLDR